MAVNAFTLFGEINVDTRRMQQALRDANKALRDTKKEMDAVANATDRTSAANRRAANAEATHAASMRRSSDAAKAKSRDMETLGKRLGGVADKMQSFGTDMTYLVTAPLAAAGAAALKAAVDFSRVENQVNAAAGSFEAGAAKFQRLIEISRTSPGVFLKASASAYALLKQMEGLSDPSIEKAIKAMGRIKLAAPEFDAIEFARNLNQLITQGFEAQDVKQAMGRLPAFGPMLAEKFKLSASDYTTVAKEMRKLVMEGKITGDEFMNAFGDAVLNHPIYSKLDDTLGDKFLKIWQDIELAIKPIGDRIGAILLPALTQAAAKVTEMSNAFQAMSPEMQNAIIAIATFVGSIGPAIGIVGTFVGIVGALVASAKAIAGFFGVTLVVSFAAFAKVILIAVAAIAALAAIAYVAYQAYTNNFAGIADVVNKVIAALQDLAQVVVDSLQGAIRPILAALTDLWEQHGDTIVWALGEIIKGIGDLIVAIIQVNAFMMGLIGIVTRIIGGIVAYIIDGFSEVISFVKNFVNAFSALMEGNFQGAYDYIVAATRNFSNIFTRLWSGIPSLIIGYLRALFPQFDTWFKDLVAAVREWANSAGGEIGKAMIDGMVSAIWGGSDRVASALKGVADSTPMPANAFWRGQQRQVDKNFLLGMRRKNQEALKNAPKPATGGGGGGGGGKGGATKEVNAYAEELKKLANDFDTFLAKSDLFNYALQLQADNFAKVSDANKAYLIEIKRAQMAYEDYINIQNGTEEAINKLKDELFLLTTATEDERLAMEALGNLYFKVNPEIRAYVAELVKQKNSIDALNASVDQFVKNQETAEKDLQDFIDSVKEAPTNLQKFETWLTGVTAAGHHLSEAQIAAARAAMIHLDALKAQEKVLEAQQEAFNKISTGMQALGMQTDSTKVKIQEMIAALGNTAALQQMADALGIAVEDLRAKIEFEISEAQMPTFAGQWKKQLDAMKESTKTFAADVAGTLANGMSAIGDVFGQAVAEWDGTAKGFFRSLAQGFRQLIQQIIQELIRLMVMRAVTSIIGAVGGSINGGGKTNTFGLMQDGVMKYSNVPMFIGATGGLVTGPGTGTSDSIPSLLSNGEFVIPARAVRKFGVGFFEQLRNLTMPAGMLAMAGGGMVPSMSSVGGSSGSATSYNNVFNINVPPGTGSTATATMVQDNVLKALRKHERRNK